MFLCFQRFNLPSEPALLYNIGEAMDLRVQSSKHCSTVPGKLPQCPYIPSPGGLRKTAKHIIFYDPLPDLAQSCSASQPQGLSGLRKTKTSSLKVSFQDPATVINGTKHKRPSPTTSQPIPALKHCVPYTPNFKLNHP